MLPLGVKSLLEIAEMKDPVIRVLFLGILLETLLRSITSDGIRLTLDPLIDKHREKFSSFRAVDGARWVRNQIAHEGFGFKVQDSRCRSRVRGSDPENLSVVPREPPIGGSRTARSANFKSSRISGC